MTDRREEANKLVRDVLSFDWESGSDWDRHYESVVDALAVLAKFAERAPIAGSEVDGTPECSYCSGYFIDGEHEHDPAHHDHDCVWREAREALSALRANL